MGETRKQKPKRGHVIRVSDFAWTALNAKKENQTLRETVDGLLNELHDLTVRLEDILGGRSYFILPESRVVCDSEPEARGEAILRAVRKGKRTEAEEPIQVKVI
jgi:hypothetical protein